MCSHPDATKGKVGCSSEGRNPGEGVEELSRKNWKKTYEVVKTQCPCLWKCMAPWNLLAPGVGDRLRRKSLAQDPRSRGLGGFLSGSKWKESTVLSVESLPII